MTITLNNLEQPSNIICFNDIPNILKIADDDGGDYASITLQFSGTLKSITNKDGQWYLTLLGDTITNVLNPDNAINKNYYIGNSNVSIASSVARALRNCPTVYATFAIEHNQNSVYLRARNVGKVWQGMTDFLQYNIPVSFIGVSATDGNAYSDLSGAKIDVDIFSNGDYITTLEKNYYGAEAAFNLSPVLTTLAQYGDAKPFNLRISSIKNGEYTLLGGLSDNYISIGYMVNQGAKFLSNDYFVMAQNFSRGDTTDVSNYTKLYVYQPSIPLSFYSGNSSRISYEIHYLNSAKQTIYSASGTWSRGQYYNRILHDFTINLNSAYLNQSFYVDVVLGSSYVIRYNVIKPLRATEYCQRIMFRNSYGGLSFVDLTGSKTVTKDLSIETYQKNIFDYYTAEINSLDSVYNVDVKDTYTLKSHLFENDGKWIYNDLAQSSLIWTKVNGQDYEIILDSVSCDEVDSANNIYEATVKFHFSQPTTLL